MCTWPLSTLLQGHFYLLCTLIVKPNLDQVQGGGGGGGGGGGQVDQVQGGASRIVL